ncbi:hypothetical protein CPBF424_09400 [Xanthomonas euroxanthea]|uniref:Uncharacterized protein n=1 Tax=Xanthomonas euroxanthea TaxID=2259622 RepID=A0AA46H9L6_9XANT|nr:hypothetical protein CPBF424_09400 [Xanthomonas euroxanthea]
MPGELCDLATGPFTWLRSSLPGCGALVRPPSRDTPQVRPCRLRRGIHAAQGPATVSGQGPVERVGVHGKSGAGCVSFDREASVSPLVQASLQIAFQVSAEHLSGAVSSPVAGPCGGMDAATEPPGTGSRRVPQAVRAPRPRLARLLTICKNTAANRKPGVFLKAPRPARDWLDTAKRATWRSCPATPLHGPRCRGRRRFHA